MVTVAIVGFGCVAVAVVVGVAADVVVVVFAVVTA